MRTLVLVLVTLAFLSANVEAYPSPNAMSNILLAYRFVTEGSARISGFDEIAPGLRNWETTEGFSEYNRFGPGTAVVLSPAVAVAAALGVAPRDVGTWGYIDKVVATLLVAVAALATFAAARRIAGDGAAHLAVFAAVAGTSLATVASQRTWQHPLGVAAVAIAWLWVVRGQEDERWIARAGLPLALAITARYPLAVVWVACLAYVALTHRRLVLQYLLWSAGPLLFLAIYTTVVFGSPVSNSYGPQLWQWAGLLGLPGNLVSPSRGLLVFSPFLAAGLYVIGRRAWRREPLWLFALASFLALWLVHGTYIGWWGGWSYGNRYLLEAVPILAAGVALAWRDAGRRGRYALAAAILFAVVIQVAGLLAYYHYWDGFNWDDARVQADDGRAASAMWDVLDAQWWWTIRAAVAGADARMALLVPVTAAFGYLALRAGLARPGATAPTASAA